MYLLTFCSHFCSSSLYISDYYFLSSCFCVRVSLTHTLALPACVPFHSPCLVVSQSSFGISLSLYIYISLSLYLSLACSFLGSLFLSLLTPFLCHFAHFAVSSSHPCTFLRVFLLFSFPTLSLLSLIRVHLSCPFCPFLSVSRSFQILFVVFSLCMTVLREVLGILSLCLSLSLYLSLSLSHSTSLCWPMFFFLFLSSQMISLACQVFSHKSFVLFSSSCPLSLSISFSFSRSQAMNLFPNVSFVLSYVRFCCCFSSFSNHFPFPTSLHYLSYLAYSPSLA